ncbi:hypothetical protein FHU36_000847 [Nonomuraea muscovyensis]|uniref:Uncharacterized protein n=1 Tax=Nonomuraea muscovyensis TaxID=1124761 RepID=A0A7X0BXA9_9ACTN|nr:hypothetical protein [Nonomuraea muscovyensis]MBB6344338.1 hypothetical protein [Nonomuraea muscovyensis]
MGCGCKGGNRQQFEVVTTDEKGDDKVVYTSTSEPTATAVARRYPGSTVRTKRQQTSAGPRAGA